MSKRRKTLIIAALAAGALLVPSLTLGTSSGSTTVVNQLLKDRNFISSTSIINNSIKSIDIMNNSITSIDIKNKSITKADLASDVLTLRAYGRIENGEIVAKASKGLAGITHPDLEVTCVTIDGVSDASTLAPQVTQLVVDGHYASVTLEASSPSCPKAAVALMASAADSFTILIP